VREIIQLVRWWPKHPEDSKIPARC
jgi:hypothetical protein